MISALDQDIQQLVHCWSGIEKVANLIQYSLQEPTPLSKWWKLLDFSGFDTSPSKTVAMNFGRSVIKLHLPDSS
jgi:hypothetical protein